MPTLTDAERIDWLQRRHTLHKEVHILYVVDGWEVQVVEQDSRILGDYHGKDLREAIDKAAAIHA